MQNTYSYLDLGQFRSLYCTGDAKRKMKFYVEGIKCSKCISKIESLKSKNPELETLEVDLANQTALVELKDTNKSFARVAEDIAGLGFRPIPIQTSDDSAEQWRKESKNDLTRVGVAGFCAGNIMMLAFATYFGLDGPMRKGFEWIQFFLYLPVFTYVAWPFYKGFVTGLRQKSLSIDGPMAIASSMGFIISAWNLMRGTGSIYFDSTSGFLFLILATRYFQKRTRFEYLKFLKPTALAQTFKARLLDQTGNWKWVRSDELKFSDVITVEAGEWVPADGSLLTAEAVIDLSVLDGESMPRRVQTGFTVKAGTKLLSDEANIQVTKSGNNTTLGHLLGSVSAASISETQSSRVSDKASQVLLATVLSMAFVALLAGFFGNFETQFEKAFALIVLACPCAMAFGTPLAFSFSMRRAHEKGIVVKSARVFESLSEIKTIFLDKTGTLTERFWNLTNSNLNEADAEPYKGIILLLESKSEHPVAFALREVWSSTSLPELTLENFQENRSQGVSGEIDGAKFEFKHFNEANSKWFGLSKNGNLVWKFQLRPVLLEGTRDCIDDLKKAGFDIKLISGDSKSETLEIGRQLGLDNNSIFAELSPLDKEDLVKQIPHSVMIGDGVNDSLALQAAQIGIAVKGGVDLALKSADVLFLNGGITSFPELLKLSAKARRQIRRNLTSALVYNTLGGSAALLGFVNPFVAALLMPISSIYILTTTWWGTRQ
jgi:Cu2+-exporting ATPase/Cu+-exporting ATPase